MPSARNHVAATAVSRAVVVGNGSSVFNPRALATHVPSKPRSFLLSMVGILFAAFGESKVALTGQALDARAL